jgi:hypothetical protein
MTIMELKEFIKTALVDIIQGVYEAKSNLDEQYKYGCICPEAGEGRLTSNELVDNIVTNDQSIIYQQKVDFDIAVTIENTGTKGGKVGIKVLGLEAGIGKNSDVTNTAVSRIKFHVPVALKSTR